MSLAGRGAAATLATARVVAPAADRQAAGLQRQLRWTGAFWAASGVPAAVLFTIGSIAATIGQPAWAVWIASILMGFMQSFTYAEIAGLFPAKSGGASIYGASAWIGYGKFLAPISVWCNWLAWSPALAVGTGLAAGYVVTALFAPDSAFATWEFRLLDLGAIHAGLSLRINAVFFIAAAFLLLTFALQHRGVGRAARLQTILGIAALLPLLLVGLAPLLGGQLRSDRFFPLLPLHAGPDGQPGFGAWDRSGLTLLAGSLFVAAWSTYGFETAICYTREFRDPRRDTFKAIFASGLLCILVFTLVPVAFQATLGLGGLLDKGIYDGTGVGQALARMVGGGAFVTRLVVLLLLVALLLVVTTSMMGSSRTLYQAARDGWLPRYLARANDHGAPTAAMWTDLVFNLLLLLMSDYLVVLAVSNVCYLLFNFLNLQAGWIHRLDRPQAERPFRCPTPLLAAGAVLGFVNLGLVGAGADVWGPGTLRNGLIAVALILPVFAFRHYVQDRGEFPVGAQGEGSAPVAARRAGWLPYAALAAGAALLGLAHAMARLPG